MPSLRTLVELGRHGIADDWHPHSGANEVRILSLSSMTDSSGSLKCVIDDRLKWQFEVVWCLQ